MKNRWSPRPFRARQNDLALVHQREQLIDVPGVCLEGGHCPMLSLRARELPFHTVRRGIAMPFLRLTEVLVNRCASSPTVSYG